MYQTAGFIPKAAPSSKGGPARRETPNRTGIPAQLKSLFEAKSGLSLDDVRVHYNSPEPARLQALAYTRGNQVYMGPGQERHLEHELGHVVQQKQGLVRPTAYLNGLPLNDSPALEQAAGRGAEAVQRREARGRDVVQRVKVYVIEDLDWRSRPKTTFLTAAAGRVKTWKMNKHGGPDRAVEEFHTIDAGRTAASPPVVDVDEMLIFKSHGNAPGLLGGPSFGGYTPAQLAEILISRNYLPDHYHGRITLSGCETAMTYRGVFGSGLHAKRSFADLFKAELTARATAAGKALGVFEVKGTLGTARTGVNGRLLVDEDGSQINLTTVRPNKRGAFPKKHWYSSAIKYVSGKEGKQVY